MVYHCIEQNTSDGKKVPHRRERFASMATMRWSRLWKDHSILKMTFVWCLETSISMLMPWCLPWKIPSGASITVVTPMLNLHLFHRVSLPSIFVFNVNFIWLYLTLIMTRCSPSQGCRFKLSSLTLTEAEPRSIKHYDRWLTYALPFRSTQIIFLCPRSVTSSRPVNPLS